MTSASTLPTSCTSNAKAPQASNSLGPPTFPPHSNAGSARPLLEDAGGVTSRHSKAPRRTGLRFTPCPIAHIGGLRWSQQRPSVFNVRPSIASEPRSRMPQPRTRALATIPTRIPTTNASLTRALPRSPPRRLARPMLEAAAPRGRLAAWAVTGPIPPRGVALRSSRPRSRCGTRGAALQAAPRGLPYFVRPLELERPSEDRGPMSTPFLDSPLRPSHHQAPSDLHSVGGAAARAAPLAPHPRDASIAPAALAPPTRTMIAARRRAPLSTTGAPTIAPPPRARCPDPLRCIARPLILVQPA